MNVLLFPSAYHPSLGGVEELSRQLAMELARQGHGVAVMANRWPRDLPRVERLDGIDVHRLPLRTRGAGWKSEVSYRLTSSLVQRDVTRLVRAHRADVVHVICVWPGVTYALDACAAIGVPVVTTLQGELTMDANKLYEKSESARGVLRRALSESLAVTACSEHTLAEARAFAAEVMASDAVVVPNGIAPGDFVGVAAYRHARPYVLAMGRHVEQKGFDLLLRAWASVRPAGLDLLIAGDGPERAALEVLSRSLGITDTVQFVGRADRERVASLLAGSTLFVLSSRHEPFGIVLLEAMASGAPVLATRVGGVPEVVEDGVSGLLVEASVEGLAGGLQRMVSNEAMRRRCAEAGRRRASRFTWESITRRYVEVYDRAIARCAARRERAEAVSA
jgi:glycosyltransferase involved in cell wall biosynthesis